MKHHRQQRSDGGDVDISIIFLRAFHILFHFWSNIFALGTRSAISENEEKAIFTF